MVVTSGLSFWRTSELNEAAYVSEQLTEARQKAGDDLVVSGSFFQETKKAKLMDIVTRVAAVAAPALAATGVLVAGVAAGPALLLAGGLAAVTALMANIQAPRLKSELADYNLARKEQHVEGLNVWRDGAPPTEVDAEVYSKPDVGLRELLVCNMRDFPGSYQIVHANGHGMGAKYSAGMATEDLARAVDGACQKTADVVDVAVLDTCFGASFEALSRLARKPGNVKYVVGFEDAVPNGNSQGGRVPLNTMLEKSLHKDSARDVALAMAEAAGQHFESANNQPISQVPLPSRLSPSTLEQRKQGMDSTVAAVDMEALRHKLSPALDKAGAKLKEALADPAIADAVTAAKKACEIEFSHDLVDLGGFLTRVLEKVPEGSELHGAVKAALESLQETLMLKRTGKRFPLSGLSFHTQEKPRHSREMSPAPSRPLDGDHLPKQWVDFVKAAF